MSDQDNGQVSTLQRPTTNDLEEWKTYWEAQGWSWRTEPEINEERQKFLTECLSITPNIKQGIYPFKDIQLNRDDIEWLIMAHGNGKNEFRIAEYTRGLDLRGAILSFVDLNRLPLVQIRGGVRAEEWMNSTEEEREAAAIHLEGANLEGANLTNASMRCGHLENAKLNIARLERATLRHAYLNGADLRLANFDYATRLDEILLGDIKTGFTSFIDANWNGVNLTAIQWSQMKMTSSEQNACKKNTRDGKRKDKQTRLSEYKEAVRANRQLATVLQSQGMNEDAARFAYRAQKLQRVVFRRQKKFGQYIFSIFLDLLAGYGYRPGRSVLWYLATIFGFALAYFAIGHLPIWPDAIVYSLTSFHGRGFLPSLDGQIVTLHYPLVVIAAFEAVVGLLIEISFIATFTQRFFGR